MTARAKLGSYTISIDTSLTDPAPDSRTVKLARLAELLFEPIDSDKPTTLLCPHCEVDLRHPAPEGDL